MPISITEIDSIVSENASIEITRNNNIVEIKPINNSEALNTSVRLGEIYHNEIEYNKTPAFEAGIKRGDRIVSIGKQKIKYGRDVKNIGELL